MSKSKKKKSKAEPRDVEFSANFETSIQNGTDIFSQAATLTDSEALLVQEVLAVLLPRLDKDAHVATWSGPRLL